MDDLKGIVTCVQRMSFHDGPGIRSTIFFKGCNWRCKWCHNPETLSMRPEMGWYESRCIHCGACVGVCKCGALSVDRNEILRNRDLCVACGRCADACGSNAHYRVGTLYSVDDLVSLVEQDRRVFEISGGGVTISGGEPTMQPVFLGKLVEVLHHRGFHITLQTNMAAAWNTYESMLPYIDFFMCDLKLFAAEKHRFWTGKDNSMVLRNILKLDETGKSYCVRTPVVPGVNDDEEELSRMSCFINSLKSVKSYELLPFHRLATYKYHSLDMDYDFSEVAELSKERMQELKDKFEK